MRHDIGGTYTEIGKWHDTAGNSGELRGRIAVVHEAGGLAFEYGDGGRQSARIPDDAALHAPLVGEASLGTLFFCDDGLILEYEADSGGRKEQNTDVWVFRDGTTTRFGVIRQPGRTIWFEAVMVRSS